MSDQSPDQKLLGKSILVIGSDTTVIKSLINQLAQKGADIALICWQMQLDSFLKIKDSVQAAGRRFLLVEQVKTRAYDSQQLVSAITAELGQLDAIIDLTSPTPGSDTTPEANPWLKKPGWPFTKIVAESWWQR